MATATAWVFVIAAGDLSSEVRSKGWNPLVFPTRIRENLDLFCGAAPNHAPALPDTPRKQGASGV